MNENQSLQLDMNNGGVNMSKYILSEKLALKKQVEQKMEIQRFFKDLELKDEQVYKKIVDILVDDFGLDCVYHENEFERGKEISQSFVSDDKNVIIITLTQQDTFKVTLAQDAFEYKSIVNLYISIQNIVSVQYIGNRTTY